MNKEFYITYSKQEQDYLAMHNKTNLLPIIVNGSTNGYIRLIRTLNSNTIAEFRFKQDGVDKVFYYFTTEYGVGMLFNQPTGLKIEVREGYVYCLIPEPVYNIFMGVGNEATNS